jgi:hypothetical protein
MRTGSGQKRNNGCFWTNGLFTVCRLPESRPRYLCPLTPWGPIFLLWTVARWSKKSQLAPGCRSGRALSTSDRHVSDGITNNLTPLVAQGSVGAPSVLNTRGAIRTSFTSLFRETRRGVLRGSTHGPRPPLLRRSGRTRGPWPPLRYCLIARAPPRPLGRLPIVGGRPGRRCRFIGPLAPAGIPFQALPVGPPGHGSRPARSGALVLPAGCHGPVTPAPLRSRACGAPLRGQCQSPMGRASGRKVTALCASPAEAPPGAGAPSGIHRTRQGRRSTHQGRVVCRGGVARAAPGQAGPSQSGLVALSPCTA